MSEVSPLGDETDARRVIGKQRVRHDHVGQTCAEAGCPTRAVDLAETGEGDHVLLASDGFRLTDAGNSGRLIAQSEGRLRYTREWASWVVYLDGRWQVDVRDALVTDQAKQVVKKLLCDLDEKLHSAYKARKANRVYMDRMDRTSNGEGDQ
jgi:hypothetical protein